MVFEDGGIMKIFRNFILLSFVAIFCVNYVDGMESSGHGDGSRDIPDRVERRRNRQEAGMTIPVNATGDMARPVRRFRPNADTLGDLFALLTIAPPMVPGGFIQRRTMSPLLLNIPKPKRSE